MGKQNVKFSNGFSIQNMPVSSAIIFPTDKQTVIHDGKVKLQGWAYSGGGNWVERVEVSNDGYVRRYMAWQHYHLMPISISQRTCMVLRPIGKHDREALPRMAALDDRAARRRRRLARVLCTVLGLVEQHRADLRPLSMEVRLAVFDPGYHHVLEPSY